MKRCARFDGKYSLKAFLPVHFLKVYLEGIMSKILDTEIFASAVSKILDIEILAF